MHELISRSAIQKTIAHYSTAVDRGDIDRLLSVFTSQAAFQPLPNYPICHGHTEIKAFFADLQARMEPITSTLSTPFILEHHLTTSTVDFTAPDNAKGFTRFLVMSPQGIDHSGFYTDTFSSNDGIHWLLSQRRIHLSWIAPQSPVRTLLETLQAETDARQED